MEPPIPAELVTTARQWQLLDPDPETRHEVDLLLAGPVAELADRFEGRIEFGTAGLRAATGAGPTRMNRLVVRQTVAAIVHHLASKLGRPPKIVVGRDARHGSEQFAADATGVITAGRGTALVIPGPCPTPVVAFAVTRFQADAGLVITASHNPPSDSGLKVYLGDGAQLVPPSDSEIADEIDLISAGETPSIDPEPGGEIREIHPVEDYLDSVTRLLFTDHRDVQTVYSALHGVGSDVIQSAFARAGFPPPSEVIQQAEPDPNFPTVQFPNPEEAGSMDLALAEARRLGADVVLVNDGDADRLGVAVPTLGADSSSQDGWRLLSGDEIGTLLAAHVLDHTSGPDRLVVSTIASSRMLAAMAASYEVRHQSVLTGTKWIGRAALDTIDHRFVFGYEEALGYLVGDVVHDKDGISAALLVAELVAELRLTGRTVHDRLEELARAHGLHQTRPWSLRFDANPEGTSLIADIMSALRSTPPDHLGDVAVTSVTDLLDGSPDLPASNVLILDLADGSRVVVRPSGTEPKAKFYLEAVISDVVDVAAARVEVDRRLTAMQTALEALVT